MKYIQELKLVECVSDVGVRLDYASCACPAGVGGGCQHIAALFFTIEKCRLTVAKRLPGPETCTSLERAWGPRQRDIAPKPLSDVTVERPRALALCTATEPQSKCSCVQSTLFDSRRDRRPVSQDDVSALVQNLKASATPGNKCLWLSLLDPEAPITLAKSKFGEIADGSHLVYQQPRITEVSTATPTAATAACAIMIFSLMNCDCDYCRRRFYGCEHALYAAL